MGKMLKRQVQNGLVEFIDLTTGKQGVRLPAVSVRFICEDGHPDHPSILVRQGDVFLCEECNTTYSPDVLETVLLANMPRSIRLEAV